MIKYEKLISCPLCGSSEANVIASNVKDYEWQTVDDSFEYALCKKCGLAYMNPVPRLEDMHKCYPPSYEQYSEGMTKRFSLKKIIQSLRTKIFILPRIKFLLKQCGKPDALKVLDIGCGNGHSLLAVKSVLPDAELHGADIASGQDKFLTSKGIIFHCGEIETLELAESYFDIVILSHSIEHFFKPLNVAAKVKKCLKPGGIVYMETHALDCFEQKLLGSKWIGFDAPRHLTVYSFKSLRMLVESNGLEVILLDDKLMSVGDIIYSTRRLFCNLTSSKIIKMFFTDKNIFLLLASMAFNLPRSLFFGSSILRVIAKKP